MHACHPSWSSCGDNWTPLHAPTLAHKRIHAPKLTSSGVRSRRTARFSVTLIFLSERPRPHSQAVASACVRVGRGRLRACADRAAAHRAAHASVPSCEGECELGDSPCDAKQSTNASRSHTEARAPSAPMLRRRIGRCCRHPTAVTAVSERRS